MSQSLMPLCGKRALRGVLCLLLAALPVGCSQETGSGNAGPTDGGDQVADSQPEPADDVAQPEAAATSDSQGAVAAEPSVEVTSCDGENTVSVAKDLTGEPLADALLGQWKRDNVGRDWVTEEKQAHAFNPPANNSDLLQGEQGSGHTYGNYTQRDLLTWEREAEKFVAEGSRIFHSAGELGSTVAVSCDMCHPHASNTHPETYPKFQTQLGRVVLLRDMIDWCVENPVRGQHMDPNGPKMRALEAYIMAQRRGVEMDYGRH